MPILYYILFFMFSIFYLLTASQFQFGGITILRWVGSVLLIMYVILIAKQRKIRLPIHFIFIIIALLPTLFGINGAGTIYSYERIISWLLVVLGMWMFMDTSICKVKTLENLFEIYSSISGVLMVCSVLLDTTSIRMTGVYMNANFLSCIAVFSFVASFGLIFIRHSRIKKIIYFIFSVSAARCIIGSGSRMGIVCLICAVYIIPIVIGENSKKYNILKKLCFIIIITFIAKYILEHTEILALERLFLVSSSNNGSVGLTRGDTWIDVWNIFREKPLIGWGYAAVGYNVFINRSSTYNWGMHSSYFVILCEMGIVGSVLFLCFFAKHFIGVISKAKKIKNYILSEQYSFIKLLIICCLVMLLNAYSESFLFSVGNPMAVCFWVPFVMVWIYENKLAKMKLV